MRRLVRRGRTITRLIVVWLVAAATVLLLSSELAGFTVDNPAVALSAAAAVGVLNALVWPLLMRVALPITVLTLGIGGLLLNGLLVLVILRLIPGVALSGLPVAVAVAVVVTAVTAVTSSLVALDEDEFFYRYAAARSRRSPNRHSDVPGMIFLQIDGLGHEVLRHAIRDGDAPTLARWVGTGSHRLTSWETDWSSQTGASQCGILYGSNDDVPAFRWFEKDTGRLMVCNHRDDAAEIERRHSTGRGLLYADGASRGNLFTGDAQQASATVSVALRRRGRLGAGYNGYFANPYNTIRTFFGVLVEIVREVAAAAAQRRRDVRPRVRRGGIYPLLRSFTTVVARDAVVNAVLDDIMAGRSVVYANFLGYDEVSHHSGIERYDALAVLRGIDQQIGRLARASSLAPRPYRLVVLSDHGQSQGETFAGRFGLTFDQLVRSVCGLADDVQPKDGAGEGAWQVTAALADLAEGTGPVARALRHRATAAKHASMLSGEASRSRAEEAAARHGLLVLASGNLGMIYLTKLPGRLTLDEIQAVHPDLLPSLVEHPGIGFVLVRTKDLGPVVLGRHGAHYLAEGSTLGVDPLAPFGGLAAQQVRRTDGFRHTADIVVNSVFDPQTEEVAAFESLVGSHGGLGGPQTRPFLLYPADLPAPAEHILGAERIHGVFRGWLAHLGHTAYADEQDAAEPAGDGRFAPAESVSAVLAPAESASAVLPSAESAHAESAHAESERVRTTDTPRRRAGDPEPTGQRRDGVQPAESRRAM